MNIRDIIKEMVKTEAEIYSLVATVKEIDETERLCTVELNNGGADVFDVRLQSIVSGLIGLVIFPKIGSEVIITFTAKETAYIALFGEIEKVLLKIGDLELFVDATNMNLAVENIDLIATNTELSSDNVKVNATNTNIEAETVKVVSTSFEVQGAQIKLTAPMIDIIGAAINLNGAVSIGGSIALSGSMSLNGGANGGVPMSSPLVAKLNTIETLLNQLKTRFSSWTPVNNDGGAALKTQLNSWHTTAITPTTPDDISNPNITQ